MVEEITRFGKLNFRIASEMALPGQPVVLRGIDDREMNRYHGNQRLREQCC
jgi:hypothetical protein